MDGILLLRDGVWAVVLVMSCSSRIILENGGVYHCVSRIVDRRFIFNDKEKECFVDIMRRLEGFLGVRVLTYCVMSNHFHILMEVPDPAEVEVLSAETLRARLPLLYRGAALAEARDEIDNAVRHAQGQGKSSGAADWIEAVLARYQARMGDLSTFMKELKWRFSIWFNSKNDRCGTLWEDRFRSVLVEGDEHALMTMAAYIELNPLRAGLVDDPKDYRWSGYGEAMAGKVLAQKNLAQMHSRMRVWQSDGKGRVTWREVARVYRMHLFGAGERRLGDGHSGKGRRVGIDPKTVIKVVAEQAGAVPVHEILRGRVRYFTDGAVIGSEAFVDEVFAELRDRFGPRRKSGARPMRGADWGGMAALRDLGGNGVG